MQKTYNIKELLNSNNNFNVYKAINISTQNTVAIKKPKTTENLDFTLDILKQEYGFLKLFNDDHIVSSIELSEIDESFIVMEYLDYPTLKKIISNNRLTIDLKTDIAVEIVNALEIIHEKGILHLDVNPGNIMWDEQGKKAVFIDFSAAVEVNVYQPEFVGHRAMLGTLAYISPEQTGRTNRVIDYRADLYSLGITLYQLFTSILPFDTSDSVKLIHSHLSSTPQSPNEVSTEIPLEISNIIMKLINKDVEERYQSCSGLIYDLKNWSNDKFIPGEVDFSTTLNLSQKVYGRDDITAEIKNIFNDVLIGGTGKIFIRGFSGVGKTTLVKELYPMISSNNCNFLSGKFDQFNRTEPYYALNEALNNYIDFILSMDNLYISKFKQRLLSIMGDSLSVLLQLNPKFSELITESTHVEEVNGQEAHNRFNHAVKSLFKALASADSPLVIFLDDLQWMDAASILLFKNIFESDDIPYVLFIGSYRSNEIYSGHPLSIFIQECETDGSGVKFIDLYSLKYNNIELFICDSFKGLKNYSFLLDVLLEKTEGNIFFIKQLLNYFYTKGFIYFSLEEKIWKIDNKIKDVKVSENVAILLTDKIKNLGANLLTLLQLASALGKVFTDSLIHEILSIPMDRLNENLNIAVKEQILIRISPHKYMFSHDQLQSSVYNSMEQKLCGENHKIIFKTLINRWKETKDDDLLLNIGNHILIARSHNVYNSYDSETQMILIKASKLAIQNIAYVDAKQYCLCALEFTDSSFWNNSYNEMVDIFNNLIVISLQLGEFNQVESYFNTLKDNIKKSYDLGVAYEMKIQMLMANQQYLDGIKVGVEAIGFFGVSIPYPVDPKDHGPAISSLDSLLEDFSHEKILDMELMADKKQIVIMRILSSIIPITFNMDPNLMVQAVLKMVEISLKYGNSTYSPFAYCLYGLLLAGNFGQQQRGVLFGNIALELLDKMKLTSEYSRVANMTYMHILHLSLPLRDLIDKCDMTYIKGLENGDITFAGFSGHSACYSRYIAGVDLKTTLDNFKRYSDSLTSLGQGTPVLYQHIYMQVIYNLLNKREKQWELIGVEFNEEDMLPGFIEQGHKTALFVLYFHKMLLAYIFGVNDLALKFRDILEGYLDGGAGLMHVLIYHQFSALIKLKSGYKRDDIVTHLTVLNGLKKCVNYEHRVLLVEAELAKYEGDLCLAGSLYSDAIKISKSRRFLLDEALSRELYARFYDDIKNSEMKTYFIKTSTNCFSRWGAVIKAELLFSEFNDIKDSGTISSSTTSKGLYSDIDIHSILEFSQAIAKEIIFEKLLKKMLEILSQNAGAQRSLIVNFMEDKTIVYANYIDQEDVILRSINILDDITDIPHSVINLSINTRSIITSDNAYQDDRFDKDKYIQVNKIKSLLCFPIENHNKIIGLIYLENRLAENIFSAGRVNFLTLLSSQIVTSINNALTYKNLEELVKNRTLELERLSQTDELTGLVNRRCMNQALISEYQAFKRYKRVFSIILLDIDYFKLINDNHGHNVGDRVLKGLSKILQSCTRATDMVCRWGGEEFLILCPEITKDKAGNIAEKIRKNLESYDKKELMGTTSSFGVSEIIDQDTIEMVIKKADDSLYKAKEMGRNRVIISS